MICYVDSSILLRFLLSGDDTLAKALEFEIIGSSELIRIECNRVLLRYRLEGLVDDIVLRDAGNNLEKILSGFYLIGINRAVKQRASEAFPTVIGTLDAIHLSSAVLWREHADDEILIMTFDKQMSVCAGAIGMHTYNG